jgi:hypothetical protein
VIQIEIGETGPGQAAPISAEQAMLLARSGVVNTGLSTVRAGWWQVSGTGKVGAARIGDVVVYIRPKVPIARLLFLAGYAEFGPAWRTEDVRVDSAADLVPAMADALWRQVARAIHQGLLPGYVEIEESSAVLRGRLRESEQIRRHHGLPLPLEIRHVAVSGFLLDMPVLFESFVSRALADALAGKYGGRIHSQDWKLMPSTRLSRLPGIRTPTCINCWRTAPCWGCGTGTSSTPKARRTQPAMLCAGRALRSTAMHSSWPQNLRSCLLRSASLLMTLRSAQERL